MRRRRRQPDGETVPPLHLSRFDPAVWGNGLEAWGRWWNAREAAEAETGRPVELDVDPRFPVPDEPWNRDRL